MAFQNTLRFSCAHQSVFAFSTASQQQYTETDSKTGPKPSFKVNTVKEAAVSDLDLLQQKLAKVTPEPPLVTIFNTEKPHKHLYSRVKKNIRHSAYKLAIWLNTIRGLSINHAIDATSASNTKAGKMVLSLLRDIERRAVSRQINTEELFIYTGTAGKALGHKKIEWKGRAKVGFWKVPKSSIRITVWRKTTEDHLTEILTGKTDPGLATLLRSRMIQTKANLEEMQSLGYMLTSKGRHYRSTQFKRMVQLVTK